MAYLARGLRDYEIAYIAAVRDALATNPEGAEAAAQYARHLIENGVPVLFDQRHLSHVTGVRSQVIGLIASDPSQFYSEFRIPKRRGGSRTIVAPTPALKRVQHWLQRFVTRRLLTHHAAHGFVRERSVATNAEPHVNRGRILKLDIRDFFGSVDRGRVYRMFRFLGYSREVANLLTSLVTLDGSLPQGAPTSPDLANVAAYRLDVRLSAFAERHGLVYTRYADDLTFSGEQLRAPRVTRAIEHIVRAERFSPNDDKRRYVADHQRQTVTGLVVNDALNWPRERRRWLRQEVHFLARFGLSSHLERRGASRPAYRDFIYGHVYALNQANHREARRLLELLDSVDWT